MNNEHRNLMKNFVIWNFITGIFLFPIGIGFSVSFIITFSVGSFIFDGIINSGVIPICMFIIFFVLRILLYSNKLYQKKLVRNFIKIYLVIDILFCNIAFVGYFFRDYFEIFSSSLSDTTTKCILLIWYIFSVLILAVSAILVCRFYKKYSLEQRSILIKKIYKTYFFLIPIFVIAFISTMRLSFYAILGILENIIWGFAVRMTENQSNTKSEISDNTTI